VYIKVVFVVILEKYNTIVYLQTLGEDSVNRYSSAKREGNEIQMQNYID